MMFLNKKSFIHCILILFFNNIGLYSQIIYTDIPDTTPNATYSLDLNNDTVVDFIIQHVESAGIVGIVCYPQNNNAYSGNFVDGTYLPWALATSNTICVSLATWYDSNTPGIMALGANQGYWAGETDKYLALKLIEETNTYFGWARIDLQATSSSFTIKDYAYESTPNTCILSGQGNLNINENSNKSIFSIFPNPMIYSTTIQTNVDLKNATLTIYNSIGQIVKQINNIFGQTFTISKGHLQRGLYIISLTEENKIIEVDKLLISD